MYARIQNVLRQNLKKTDRFGGRLIVVSGGKRTAPRLYASLPRDEGDREPLTGSPYKYGFRVVLGKTIRVDWASASLREYFPRKTATEDQVVAALEFLFNLV